MRPAPKAQKEYSGAVSVFFALISAVIMALMLMILESARTEGARLYLTVAANSAIDSEFSQYHRKLWEEYRLLGLEYYAPDQISDEMMSFMKPYLNADNWFPLKVESIDLSDIRLLAEDGAEYYEKEVLDYMKYGIAASVWSYLEADNFSLGIKEGTSVDSLSDIYDDHSKEAMRLEESLEELGGTLGSLQSHYANAESALSSCSGEGFISSAESMQRELSKIPGLVQKYVRQAEKMESGLASSRQRLEAEKESGNLTEATYTALSDDIAEYESYVAEDGARRQEITGFSERAANGESYLQGLIDRAREIQEYIDNWEPSEDEEDGDDELDIDALWAPLRAELRGFDLITMNSRYGIQDKETEGKLESIKTILNSDFLRLVLPEGAELSTAVLSMQDKPSETCYSGNPDSSTELTDRVFLAEYTTEVMDYFGRGTYDSGSKKTGSGALETEYVIFGKDNDCDNLTETVKRLIEIRTGLNLIYLYTDGVKKNEARALALTITGAFGLTPLVTVTTFFILSVWALGQAVCDVRDLLGGGRVPFMHNGSSFYLTLEGLLTFAAGSIAGSGGSDFSGNAENGLKYVDYLKMLLFFGHDTGQDYRCMDIMQMCLRKSQSDFLMIRLIYSLETDVHAAAGHVFSGLGLVKANGINVESRYNMDVSTAYSY
ncbi:MAG: DUF5702 domain-containing protein [Eubacteriales bacterium]|nr:DUF5702 domain-containing protein [Eubacteriales bacterium]